jgi:hypothetical protein
MQLSSDSTCNYHQCDQTGHSVCKKVYQHYNRLIAAIVPYLPLLPDEEADRIRAIIAENPDTSTTT